MKKVLSIALAVAFVFAAMSMSVFAVAVVGNGATGTGVPASSNDGTYTDGVVSFGSVGSSSNIFVNFEKNVSDGNGGMTTEDVRKDRYAFDIDYANLTVDLTNVVKIENPNDPAATYTYTYEWNVDSYEYDLVVYNANGTVANTTNLTIEVKEAYTIPNAFTITNHSSLSINYNSAITPANADYKMSFAFEGAASGTVDAVTIGTSYATIKSDAVSIKVAPSDPASWIDVVNALTEEDVLQGDVIGTLTVTITP